MAVAAPLHRTHALSRRSFFFVAALASLLVVGAAVAFVWPSQARMTEVSVALEAVPEVEPLFVRPFDMGGSRQGSPYGIWLVRDGDRVLALWSRDDNPTRCHIELHHDPRSYGGEAWFISGPPSGPGYWQCFSSRWSRTGQRVFGPTPRGMDRFDTTVEGGTIHIDVTRLRLGECAPPEQVRFSTGYCPFSTPEEPLYRDIRFGATH